MSDYLLDKDRRRARDRLSLKEHFQDRASIDYLELLGVAPGWHCLEVGAGAGSIAKWLAQRVGNDGHVLATDLDTSLLTELSAPNLKILQHDIAADSLPPESFDLIHARDVLVHLDTREDVLQMLTTALKPGGWILLEEPDVSVDIAELSVSKPQRQLYAKVTGAVFSYLAERGLDPYFGARLYGLLHGLGYESLRAEGRVQVFAGSPDEPRSPHMMAYEDLAKEILAEGRVARQEFDALFELASDPLFAWREGFTVSVWGRRPKQNEST